MIEQLKELADNFNNQSLIIISLSIIAVDIMHFQNGGNRNADSQHDCFRLVGHGYGEECEMKITFWAVFAALVFAAILCSVLAMHGCASHAARYTGLDDQGKPYTIELTAKRFIMGQDVQGFSAQFPGGYKVGFDSSKGDPTKVMENFFGVLGPILQAYVSNQSRLPASQ